MDEAASDEASHSDETDSENDSSNRAKGKSVGDESTSSESESEEVWSGVLPEVLSRDIESAPHYPSVNNVKHHFKKLIRWFSGLFIFC